MRNPNGKEKISELKVSKTADVPGKRRVICRGCIERGRKWPNEAKSRPPVAVAACASGSGSSPASGGSSGSGSSPAPSHARPRSLLIRGVNKAIQDAYRNHKEEKEERKQLVLDVERMKQELENADAFACSDGEWAKKVELEMACSPDKANKTKQTEKANGNANFWAVVFAEAARSESSDRESPESFNPRRHLSKPMARKFHLVVSGPGLDVSSVLTLLDGSKRLDSGSEKHRKK